MGRCKWCGEPGRNRHAYRCGSNLVRQSEKCKRLVDPSLPPINKGGAPRSELRRTIEAMTFGESRVFTGYAAYAIRHVQDLMAVAKDKRALHVRDCGDGSFAVRVKPNLKSMDVGDCLPYGDDFCEVSQRIGYANEKYRKGLCPRAYCFDLIDGRYWIRRVI